MGTSKKAKQCHDRWQEQLYLKQLEFIKTRPLTLINTSINGIPTKAIAIITPKPDNTWDIEPVAILCNPEIFKIMAPPNPEDKIIIGDKEETTDGKEA